MTSQQAYNVVKNYFPISSDQPYSSCMPILGHTGYILCGDTKCDINCPVTQECDHLERAIDDITVLEFKYKATK